MQTYNSLVELARICARNARLTSRREVAVTLWKVAREYQDRAAKLKSLQASGNRWPAALAQY